MKFFDAIQRSAVDREIVVLAKRYAADRVEELLQEDPGLSADALLDVLCREADQALPDALISSESA